MKQVFLRRPLCFLCLVFTCMIYLILLKTGLPDAAEGVSPGARCSLVGRIKGKEVKNESQILYLTRITFWDAEISGNGKIETGAGVEKGDAPGPGRRQIFGGDRDYAPGVVCYLAQGQLIEDYPIGGYVKVTGEAGLFDAATNPGEFDLQKYYRANGYGFRLLRAEVLERTADHNVWLEGLWKAKQYMAAVYDRILNAEDASVVKAMTLGEKGGLDQDIKALYQKSGISHVLAISGLHISVLGSGLYRLLKKLRLPKKAAAATVLFLIVNYALLTGAGTSTIRAVVMFAYFLGADIAGRTNDPPTSLALAALAVVLVSPYFLFTSGFWLSYMAAAGITIFVPALSKGVKEPEGKNGRLMGKVRKALLTGAGLSYFTFPCICFFFYEYPVYSILLNLVVVPLMTVLIYCAFAALFLGMLWLPAGCAAAMPCHWILAFYGRLCALVETLPLHSWIVGRPPVWKILFFYAGALLVIGYEEYKDRLEERIRKKEHLRSMVTFYILALSLLIFFLPSFQRECKITLLDVGQGDGICIESPGGMVLMVDGGSSSKRDLAKYQMLPFLKSEGISRVDYWFLSHPDSDHCSGLMELLGKGDAEGIRIRCLVLPKAQGMEQECAQLVALAQENGIKVKWISAGEGLHEKGMTLDCLWPEEDASCGDLNGASMVLLLECGSAEMLLTGDATMESEERMLGKWKEVLEKNKAPDGAALGLRILKVGHHGSKTSTSQELLDAFEPDIALISAGKKNSYGHPSGETLKRLEEAGCRICRTDEEGAVTVRVRGRKVKLEEFLQNVKMEELKHN